MIQALIRKRQWVAQSITASAGAAGFGLGAVLLFALAFVLVLAFAFALAFALCLLELLVCVLQAYIFTMLSALYFGAAVEEHDH